MRGRLPLGDLPLILFMKVLALDASTHAGWFFLEGEPGDLKPKILDHGLIENEGTIKTFGDYPWSYVHAATNIANQLADLVTRFTPDVVVVEETNLGRARYSQKILEFIHLSLLCQIMAVKVIYISSSVWRQTIGLSLSREDKKNNNKIYRAKKFARETGFSLAESKTRLGLKGKGKINKKHVAVRYANELYPELKFKVKDNDRADALCLGLAYFRGAESCNGEW